MWRVFDFRELWSGGVLMRAVNTTGLGASEGLVAGREIGSSALGGSISGLFFGRGLLGWWCRDFGGRGAGVVGGAVADGVGAIDGDMDGVPAVDRRAFRRGGRRGCS